MNEPISLRGLDEIEARYPRPGHLYTEAQIVAMGWRALEDVPSLVAALRAVLDVIGPHYAIMLRREAKFGRRRSSCCCEQCRAVQAIAAALGIETGVGND